MRSQKSTGNLDEDTIAELLLDIISWHSLYFKIKKALVSMVLGYMKTKKNAARLNE